VAHNDIEWWSNITWSEVLEDLDYVQKRNMKHWLQSYNALLGELSKIDTTKKIDNTGKRIIFPPHYSLVEKEFTHRLFHNTPPFVDGCLHCRREQDLEERRHIYNL